METAQAASWSKRFTDAELQELGEGGNICTKSDVLQDTEICVSKSADAGWVQGRNGVRLLSTLSSLEETVLITLRGHGQVSPPLELRTGPQSKNERNTSTEKNGE